MATFRPPKQILDVFSTISDGNDEQRCKAAVELVHLIEKSEEKERKNLLQYCQERLIRGLSSSRKFARVGFAIALVQLLQQNKDLDTDQVLATIKDKLKIVGPEKKTQSEIGGIYLGRVFAMSALIQAGRADQLSREALSSLVEDLLKLAQKKSYLRAVCHSVLQDIISKVPADVFEASIWPKIKVRMKEGWEASTLDKVALLLTCRTQFPQFVKKKFLKKHWGFPLFAEENDEHLRSCVLASGQRSAILVEQVVPEMLKSGRSILSAWNSIGEKLMEELPEKKSKTMVQRRVLGLTLASKLAASTDSPEQILEMILSPGLARCLFHTITKKSHPVATAADSLCQLLSQKLKGQVGILAVLEKAWKMDTAKPEVVKSNNFLWLMDLMCPSETTAYIQHLMSMLKGDDPWTVLLSDSVQRSKQMECCLRQLQHLCVSHSDLSTQTQLSVLGLFLRLAFFQVRKGTAKIEHCENCTNFDKDNAVRKLSEQIFFKLLDSFSAASTAGHQKKKDQLLKYLELLYGLASYMQSLLKSKKVSAADWLPTEVKDEWLRFMEFCTTIRQISQSKEQNLHSSFLLLVLFLGFYMLTSFKLATELLEDVYVCYQKATSDVKVNKTNSDEPEPEWVDVLMDVLLKLMSLRSHLGRVVAANVFNLLSDNITPSAVMLISEVIVPNKSPGENGEDILVETDDNDDEDLDEESDVEMAENGVDEDDDEDSILDDNNNKDSLNDEGSDEESLPDLSDSEMFKMDEKLAEVFRLKKQTSVKKVREEKKEELINFQVRVLDFIEILIKGDRCGDFILNLLKPLVSMVLKSRVAKNQVLAEKAKHFLTLIKSKVKTLKDNIHTLAERDDLFRELLSLAKKVSDKSHLQEVATACHLLASINFTQAKTDESSESFTQPLMNSLEKVLSKKSSKPPVAFFTVLIEIDPSHFQGLAPMLTQLLRDESLKPHGRMICCLVLASLCKKTYSIKSVDLETMRQWMQDAAESIIRMLSTLDKTLFYKDVLTLAAALQARQDVFPQPLFGNDVKDHLMKVKSKFNTDLRRLANKVISAIDRQTSQKKSAKKRKRVDSVKDKSAPANKKKS